MEAKDNLRGRLRGGKHGKQTEAKAQSASANSVAQPTSESQGPATIRKGIYLSTLIYIEGDQPPAQDFNALAKAALKDRLAAKNSPEYADLTMTLKKVEEQTDIQERDEESKNGGKDEKGGKFEF